MAIRIKVTPPPKAPSVQPMQAAKHFDIVLGLDFHLLRVPFFITPCPITPFGALVFDPMDYIHITIPAMPVFTDEGFSLQPVPMGGSVTVNGFYRGGATTSLLGMPPTMPPIPAKFKAASAIAKKLSLIHLIIPKPLFWLPFLAPHDGQISMGSSTVITQGLKQSTHMDPAWSCNELGKILMNSPTALYNDYATRIMIVLPLGKAVIVGGTRVYPEMGLKDLLNALIMMGILKGGGKLARKGLGKALTKLNKALSKKFPKFSKFANRVQPAICKYLGEPVDAASGHMHSWLDGFTLPGPIPFKWEANYYSDTTLEGSLGKNIIHSYDISLKVLEEEGLVLMNDAQGRGIAFSTLLPGESEFNELEKYKLHRDIDTGEYYTNSKEGLYYYFNKSAGSDGLQSVRSIVNRNGFAIRFSYDTAGHLQQITDSAGRLITIHSNEKGLITSVDIPHPSGEGVITPVQYLYDAEGRLVRMTDVEGAANEFGWKKQYITSRKFKDGTEFTFTYNKDGKCTAAEGPEGLFSYFFEYKPGHTIVTNSLGHTSHYYHRKGLVLRQVNPEGGQKTFTYDANHNLVAEQNEIGIVHTYEYDTAGNMIKMGLPGQGEVKIGYNEQHLPESTLFPNKALWQYEYDMAGNLLQSVNPMGDTVQYKYYNGLLQTITAINGATTELWYDREYNLSEVKLPAGQGLVRYSYDALGNCVKVIDPANKHQLHKYDLKGRMVQVVETNGNIMRAAYDVNDNMIGASDNHNSVQMGYNFFGDIVRRSQGSSQISFGYNTEGKLTFIENEHHEFHLMTYDADGNIVKETGFDGLTRSYLRDLAGQTIEIEKQDGRFVRYRYNTAGQMTNVFYTDGTSETYSYDAAGNLVKAANSQGNIQLQRDILGRVTGEMQGDEHRIGSEYNKMGWRTRVTSSLGADIQLQYNMESGMLESLRAGTYEESFAYNRHLKPVERRLPGNINEKFEYDINGRLIKHQVEHHTRSRHQRQYSWDTGNRLKSIIDSDFGQKQFGHDVYGNLSQIIYGDGTIEYRMPDAVDNLFETKARTDRQYGKGGKLVKSKKATYDYDEEGNLLRKKLVNGDMWQYKWNENGTLAEIIRPDGQSVYFGYDALARRIWKRYKSTVTRWVWDGNTPLHEWKELDARETSPDDIITWVFEEGCFAPSAKMKGNKKYSVITDNLGTPVKAFNEEGKLVWNRELDSYGRPKMLYGDEGFCNYLYPGQYADAETELVYNRYRYYIPEEGIYISKDPISIMGGLNPYSYVHDPTTYTDILGLSEGSKELGDALINAGHNHGGLVTNATRTDYRAHHIIPHKVWTDNGQFFKDIGMGDGSTVGLGGKDKAANGVWLPKSKGVGNASSPPFDHYHAGNHASFSRRIRTEVEGIRDAFNAGTITKKQARVAIRDLQRREKRDTAKRTGGGCSSVIR